MHRRFEFSREVDRLIAQQEGILSRQQALQLGIPRATLARLLNSGQWQSMLPGTFVTHDQPASWESLAWAGLLVGGETARIGGYAAGHLHRLIDAEPDVITILIPHRRQLRSRGRFNFVREREGVRQPRSIGSLSRTTIDDTILDLSANRFHDGPVESPAHWVTRAIQLHLTTPQRLRDALADRRRIPYREELEAMLTDVDNGTESPLELSYICATSSEHTDYPLGPARSAPQRAAKPGAATSGMRHTGCSSNSMG